MEREPLMELGGTVKQAADTIVLHGNDIADGKAFFDKVSNSLQNVQLYKVEENGIEKYESLLSTCLKPLPATRKIHQVIPLENSLYHRQLSCFCKEPNMCQYFSPAEFRISEATVDSKSKEHASANPARTSPLELLMEERLESEEGPEGTTTKITAGNIEYGDWLAVVYDDHWWLAKVIAVDAEENDVKVEFLHPHGPNPHFQPKHGRKDLCFSNILVKLMGNASPLLSSSTRGIYSISPEVMDFIEGEHINRLLPCH
ncbi:UNVERIFIED_CONTAM: hypothetical protein FKN15_041214 [Acipenser sinensis]